MALWRCEFGKSRKLLFNLTVKTGIEEILIRVPAHGHQTAIEMRLCIISLREIMLVDIVL